MEDTVLKVAMAAFFHDIGKFVHGDLLGIPPEYRNNNSSLYQPVDGKTGRYSHDHALFSAWFIEHPEIRKHLPPCCNRPGWGQGDSFLNLAAMHHKPETAMQWVITEADRLSSGYDRKEYEDARSATPRDYQKVRLSPLFEQLDPEGRSAPFLPRHAYPLAAVGPQTIFPVVRDDATPETWEAARAEYASLVEGFVGELAHLRHGRENVSLWFEHFDSLVLRYTACVPSDRSGKVLPDVSLYEHLRGTSALAAALYLYHRERGTLHEREIKDEDQEKFLMVHGDFYGIQDFIATGYGEARKLRSKLLRGRSFFVSLITDLAADSVLRAVELPFCSCTYNAAGKFSIIAPNTPAAREAVRETEDKVNHWLYGMTHGESGLGVTWVEAAPRDFSGKEEGYPTLMDRVATAMEARKCRRFDLARYAGPVVGYLEGFEDGGELCRLCGKRPASRATEADRHVRGIRACAPCRDQAFLGERLAGSLRRLAVLDSEARIDAQDNRLLAPIFGKYQVAFLRGDEEPLVPEGSLLHYWDLGEPGTERWASDITLHQVGGYIPRVGKDAEDRRVKGALEPDEPSPHPEEPKTFGMIAAMARTPAEDGDGFLGIEALGVLKADVDHLGVLMACGVPEGQRTMSRVATLSRQLHTFFGVYLPHLLATDQRFRDIYTVFAGGDDLFLIGPWNRCMELALCLEEQFGRYVCENPHVRFSAGMGLHKAATPVPLLAQSAEDALTASKEGGRNRLTVFGASATWEQARAVLQCRDRLNGWFERGIINTAFLYQLNGFIGMVARERSLGEMHSIALKEMACTRWRAFLAYQTGRNVAKNFGPEERAALRQEVHTEVLGWLLDHGDALRMALWNTLYNMRRR